MSLTFGSLFAGIGGFDLGFERAGMVCKWQVEIDPFCQKVLAKHWPNVQRYADVREVGKHNLEPVDVICGGFPCQPHSLAGKRKGAADDRDLWPEYHRVIDELRPAWVVGENVPGIIGTILDQVLFDLEGLSYQVQAIGFPAAAFDAPHIRERIFVFGWNVADTKGRRCRFLHTENDQENYREGNASSYGSEILAHTNGDKQYGRGSIMQVGRKRSKGEIKRNGNKSGIKWSVEPGVGRVADGIPNRVDRLRSLGNSLVPQNAELIASLILRLSNKGMSKQSNF